MFHCSLQKEILDMTQKMPVMRSTKDSTSKAGLKTAAFIKKVSNDPKVITDNYEVTRQFSEATGECALLSAWKEFQSKLLEKLGDQKVKKSKSMAKKIIEKFKEFAQINCFLDGKYKPEFFDDCHKDATDNMNRTILSKLLRKAVKQSDGLGILSVSLALIPFFLNRDITQNSKYAPLLLWFHIEYLRASTPLKKRLLRTMCINTSGTLEGGVSWDMENEFCIMLVKNLLKTLKITTGLHADQAVLDLPVSNRVVSNDAAAVGAPFKKAGHAYRYLTEENLQEMMAVFDQVKLSSKTISQLLISGQALQQGQESDALPPDRHAHHVRGGGALLP